MSDWYVRNFTTAEVACPCCGRSEMSEHTILKFQKARDILGIPIFGTSWCRCEKHNAAVGGVADSAHLIARGKECTAGDVTTVPASEQRPMTSHERYKLHEALRAGGFERFGFHKWYIHTDDNPDKPQECIWLY